jgi:hypothetical protein
MAAQAMAAIDAAIRFAEQATHEPETVPPDESRRQLLVCRHDKARLLHYFTRQYQAAADMYRSVIAEGERDARLRLQAGIAKRNLSECLERLRWQGESVPEPVQIAGEAVREIRAAAPENPVIAEAMYTEAKLAERAGQKERARALLEETMRECERVGNWMVWAIAKARNFWVFKDYIPDEWNQIAAELERYPGHAWAVRSLIDGRLRAARLDFANGDLNAARDQLERCKGALLLSSSFDEGSDRDRIAVTAAGLSLLGRASGAPDADLPWSELLSRPWAARWLADRGLESPAQVWQRVY